MGYRSDVYIKIKPELKEDLDRLLDKYDLNFEVTKDEYHVRYECEWLKWYDGYEDVDAINNFIEDNAELAGLIAVGEDGAQSANCGDPYRMNMHIITTVDW